MRSLKSFQTFVINQNQAVFTFPGNWVHSKQTKLILAFLSKMAGRNVTKIGE